MAAAVVVTSPAGPPTPECPIWLQANEPIVTDTQQFIDWQPAPADPAGAARVSIDTFQAVKAFVSRCKLSRTPVDMAAAAMINVLTIRFEDAFWSRLLTELKASGVFVNPITELGGLLDSIGAAATITNPPNLEIVAADWRMAPAFAAGPGGAGAAAVATRAALAQVRFFSLLPVTRLEKATASCPFLPACTVVGILGPCLTQLARQSEISSVRLAADGFRALQPAAPLPTDGALAMRAASFLPSQRLPFPLQAVGVGESELREEYEDGVEYNKSADGRRLIEEKRVLLLGSTAHGYAAAAQLLNPRSALAVHYMVSRTTSCIDSGVVGNSRRAFPFQPDHRFLESGGTIWQSEPLSDRISDSYGAGAASRTRLCVVEFFLEPQDRLTLLQPQTWVAFQTGIQHPTSV